MTRERVMELWRSGLRPVEIARQLGLAKSTVAYHLRGAGVPADERFSRRYDWNAIRRFYDGGRSLTECRERFGFSMDAWAEAARRGDVTPRPRGEPLERYLVRGRRVNRMHLKARLIAAGLKPDRCERCGAGDWRGRPLSVALHHVNGDGCDNRLENLQLLCPNCHSQTPNYGGRNTKVRRGEALLVSVGAQKTDELRGRRLPLLKLAA